ncbi:MAG TPA: YdhR family protein [Acidimicrobiales bacterium]|nr:YdhR family protein [Acidimicrobiales bacterium]
MQILIVTFGLEGLSEAEYYRGCDSEAPTFADIPGMIAKVWIADPDTNTYGGVYTFRDPESLEAYLGCDLFRAMQEAPEFTGLTAKRFAVLEGPTRITHGAAVHAA